MDYEDESKVLVVPTKDYSGPPADFVPVRPMAQGVTSAQQEAIDDASSSKSVPNTALDPNAPAITKVAASEEIAPLGTPVVFRG